MLRVNGVMIRGIVLRGVVSCMRLRLGRDRHLRGRNLCRSCRGRASQRELLVANWKVRHSEICWVYELVLFGGELFMNYSL